MMLIIFFEKLENINLRFYNYNQLVGHFEVAELYIKILISDLKLSFNISYYFVDMF